MAQRVTLDRAVTLPGAVMMGLGSIVGTGVFVSLGFAAGLAGSAMVFALLLAGCLAICNGLSTAQLAASHPVSGGTYEYASRYIHPWSGFLAGWLFVCAKSASAATAAIGLGGYCIYLFGLEGIEPWQIGLVAVIGMTLVCLIGIQRTSLTNTVIVTITLLSLCSFVFWLFPEVESKNYFPLFEAPAQGNAFTQSFLEACALMFVAYTGYGRVATLGEEIRNPKKNIPKAIVATLAISFVLYLSVAFIAIGTVGAESFYRATVDYAAPLEVLAVLSGHPTVAKCLALGAITAMMGVLLNLILGVSRVVYAMGKHGDLPSGFAAVSPQTRVPFLSVWLTGAVILSLIFIKDVKATWSFSAFTVLFYYAFTNASALRLPKACRLYPRVLAWLGLFGCFGLSFWVEKSALLLGVTILIVGVIWRIVFRKLYSGRT